MGWAPGDARPLVGRAGVCNDFMRAHPRAAGRAGRGRPGGAVAGSRRRLDLGLTYDLELGTETHFDPLAELPPLAVFPAGHGLATERSGEELAAEPLVLLDLPYSRDYFRSLFAARALPRRSRSARPSWR